MRQYRSLFRLPRYATLLATVGRQMYDIGAEFWPYQANTTGRPPENLSVFLSDAAMFPELAVGGSCYRSFSDYHLLKSKQSLAAMRFAKLFLLSHGPGSFQ